MVYSTMYTKWETLQVSPSVKNHIFVMSCDGADLTQTIVQCTGFTSFVTVLQGTVFTNSNRVFIGKEVLVNSFITFLLCLKPTMSRWRNLLQPCLTLTCKSICMLSITAYISTNPLYPLNWDFRFYLTVHCGWLEQWWR